MQIELAQCKPLSCKIFTFYFTKSLNLKSNLLNCKNILKHFVSEQTEFLPVTQKVER